MGIKAPRKKVHFGLIELQGKEDRPLRDRIAVAFSQNSTPRWSVLPAQGGLAAVDEVYRRFPGCSISYSYQRIEVVKVNDLQPETLSKFMQSIWLEVSQNIRGAEPTEAEMVELFDALTIAEGDLFRQEVDTAFRMGPGMGT